MGSNRARLTVDPLGPWRLYQRAVPAGWEIMGTVQRDLEIGALARSRTGQLAQLNGGVVRSLDQRKAEAALTAALADVATSSDSGPKPV